MSEAVKPGANTLTVKVIDATDTGYQLHGKQVSTPRGIWYTPLSGIWKTVWIEKLPAVHLAGAKITPKLSGEVTLVIDTEAEAVKVAAFLKGKEVKVLR